MKYPQLAPSVKKLLFEGTVIPAHPLALDQDRRLDEERQRLLTRYYLEAGAGGVAVGVHTTQFEIRKPEHNLLEEVLKLAAEEIALSPRGSTMIRVAGIVGDTNNAVAEAELAIKYHYHLGLLSNGGLDHLSEDQLIARAEQVARKIPLFGFYLQPAAGGRLLSYHFWKKFVEIPNVVAIKIAAFNRYQTVDVVRAVCESTRAEEIALYTGNDDNIIADLITPYKFRVANMEVEKKFVGGLLGHWAVWTNKAVEILQMIKAGNSSVEHLLSLGIAVTDMNAAIFDASNKFHGCIPGIHEILRRQGILEGRWCLNPAEELSPGQMEEIDRVCRDYSSLMDDNFVKKFLQQQALLKDHD